jgi:DNA-binding MarR family transcriptional regulator
MLLEKSMPAPEIGRSLLKTREHTARLMKKLYEEGYIERETNKIPYTYKINESLRHFLEEVKSKAV